MSILGAFLECTEKGEPDKITALYSNIFFGRLLKLKFRSKYLAL